MYQKDLVGKEVIGSDAWRVGTVARLIVDPNTWQVTAVEVSLNDSVVQELRAKGIVTSSPLVVPVDRVEGISDKLVLRVKKEELANLAAQPQPASPSLSTSSSSSS